MVLPKLYDAKQYVLAQAPFDKTTASDFYRLVTQCKPELIILLMDLDSSNEAQYIISLESEVTKYGIFSIKYKKNEKIIQSKENVEKYSHYTITITWGEKNEEKYDLITFNTWVEDKVIPTQDFVKFHKSVHKLLSDKPRECSQLVVCPTGVHRAGIWTVFDMEAERLKTKNRIRFSDTIRNVRNQRCNVIEHFELFDGLLNLLVAYAKMQM
ncbi:unnamed protein product [Thelazia callipaeda]|uniref:Tyrosine-protein phosphatase domain-containing protein n=1 Tax=Thelazia callipaeda TaxID=103827 RepID=A0A158RBY5_THECL|nr:unnamed protein product [Thelazia callipaeda]